MSDEREQRVDVSDNSTETPSNDGGQVEDTARTADDVKSELGNLGYETEEQQDNTGEDFQQEQSTDTSEVYEVGDEEYQSVEEMKQGLQEYHQNEQKYQELRNKLSERNEKAKRAEQYDQFFRENEDVLKLVDQYTQDENLQTLVQAYEKDLINKKQLGQAKQYLNQQQGQINQQQGQMNQQMQQQQQENPQTQQLQQELQQLKQSQQKMVMNEAYDAVEQDFGELEDNYGDLIEQEGITPEELTQIAGQHSFFKEGRMADNLPDLEKAFNFYVANNPETFKTLQQVAQNDQKNKQQQLKQAQVEQGNTRQQGNSDEGDDLVNDIKRYSSATGGGVL